MTTHDRPQQAARNGGSWWARLRGQEALRARAVPPEQIEPQAARDLRIASVLNAASSRPQNLAAIDVALVVIGDLAGALPAIVDEAARRTAAARIASLASHVRARLQSQADHQAEAFDLPAAVANWSTQLGAMAGPSRAVALQLAADIPARISGDLRCLTDIVMALAEAPLATADCEGLALAINVERLESGRLRLSIELSPVFDAAQAGSLALADEQVGSVRYAMSLAALSGVHVAPGPDASVASGYCISVDLDETSAQAGDVQADAGPCHLVATGDAIIDLVSKLRPDVQIAGSPDALRLQVPDGRGRVARPVVVIDAATHNDDIASTIAAIPGRVSVMPVLVLMSESPERFVGLRLAMLAGSVVTTRPERRELASALSLAGRLAREAGHSLRPVDGRRAGQPDSDAGCVIVADSNRTMQVIIGTVLRRAGHRAIMVKTRDELLERLRQTSCDLVLLDLDGPILRNLDSLASAKAESGAWPKIVGLGSEDVDSSRQRHEIIDAWLTRPVEPQRLLDLVDASRAARQSSHVAVDAAEPARMQRQADHGGDAPVIDRRALDDLKSLGGLAFVEDIVTQFIGDAAIILAALTQAAMHNDVQAFRDQAHALRSCAANVGARKIYTTCLAWRDLVAADIAAHGAGFMSRLDAEFSEARVELERYLAEESGDAAQGRAA